MTLPPMPPVGLIQKVAKDGATDDTMPVGIIMQFPPSHEPPAGWQRFDPGPVAATPRRRWLSGEELRAKAAAEMTALERLVAEAIRDAILALRNRRQPDDRLPRDRPRRDARAPRQHDVAHWR
jgi:hypothetical protein